MDDMGKLEELEEELYGKESGEELAKRVRQRIVFPKTLRRPPAAWFGRKRPPAPEDKRGGRFLLKVFAALAAIVFLVMASFFVFLYLGTRGLEAEVRIYGRDAVESGEEVTVPVSFRNTSLVSLKEAELIITLPEGSLIRGVGGYLPAPARIVKKLDDILPGGEETAEITVRIFGREGEEKAVEAAFLYRPENLRARFSSKTSKILTISHVPLVLSWEAPETVSRGQKAEIRLRYNSSAPLPFDNMSLKLEYPPGFLLESADPRPSAGETIWNLGVLEPGKEGSVLLRGVMSGEEGEIKSFRGALGKFNAATKEWQTFAESAKEVRVAVTPLSVQGFLSGAREKNIIPGEQLFLTLRYRNNTGFTLKNITVRAILEERYSGGSGGQGVLEFNSLQIAGGGVFDSASRAIIWGPATTPGLRELLPEEGGELEFSIKTRSRPIVGGEGDKNLVIKFISSVGAAGIPKELAGTKLDSEDRLEFKVRSKVIFAGRSLYRSSPILNPGPLPPRTGQETAYAIFWEIRNFTSDLHNVEVRAPMPPNVKWKDKISPDDARLSWDAASGEVRWRIGEVAAGTGVIRPALAAAFQVSVTPSAADVGKSIILITGARLSGLDGFTGESIDEKIGALSTELREDPATGSSDWIVTH